MVGTAGIRPFCRANGAHMWEIVCSRDWSFGTSNALYPIERDRSRRDRRFERSCTKRGIDSAKLLSTSHGH